MNSTDQAIAILAVSGHKVDAETKLMLQKIDAGTMTYEEAIKCIEDATRKMQTKMVRTQADIDDFYDDV